MPVFLKYGEVKGEVMEPAHRSWIELENARWGSFRAGGRFSDSGAARGSSSVREIIATKKADSASVHLFRESTGGKPVPATIDFINSGETVSLRVKMADAVIVSMNISGGDAPTESLTINFSKVEFENIPGTPPP